MKLTPKLLFATLFIGINTSAFALKGDTDQPIYIDSGSQSLDLENNTVTLSDNVVITQGSIKINASKVTIIRQEGRKEKIEANGAPVTFQQTLDNGKTVQGRANRMRYDLASELLELDNNAELKQQDSAIKAQRITYDVKKQQLKANGTGNSRVKTVLHPTQIQEHKSNKK